MGGEFQTCDARGDVHGEAVKDIWLYMGLDVDRVKKMVNSLPKRSASRSKVETLAQAWMATGKLYSKEPTAARLRDWQAAEKALSAMLDELDPPQSRAAAAGKFPSMTAALVYLQQNGWKIKSTTFKNDRKKGRFLADADGYFHKEELDRYAKAWLKRNDTGKREGDDEVALRQKKLERELRALEIEVERKELRLRKEQGLYIERDQMEIELAARAGILEAGLKHWVQSQAASWIRLVDGDIGKTGHLIGAMVRDLDEHIDGYARKRDYEVVIADVATDDEEEEDEEEI